MRKLFGGQTYVPGTDAAHILHREAEYIYNGLRICPGSRGLKVSWKLEELTVFRFYLLSYLLKAFSVMVSWSRAGAIKQQWEPDRVSRRLSGKANVRHEPKCFKQDF